MSLITCLPAKEIPPEQRQLGMARISPRVGSRYLGSAVSRQLGGEIEIVSTFTMLQSSFKAFVARNPIQFISDNYPFLLNYALRRTVGA